MKAFFLGFGVFLMAVAGMSVKIHGAQTKAGSAVSGEASRGQTVFNDRCSICHFDQSTAQKMGPGLKGIYGRGKFANGKKADDVSMTAWIENGGKDMPGLKGELKPEEIRALLSYLRTL